MSIEKVQRVIKFSEKTWVKLNVDMNTELTQIRKI